ncbi:hypothetical protein Ait01nite_082190 [Actinoplanes italicus]|nr:hypothetical protein Ait01nite_082190 [Actinoplanes italicus]
MRRELIDAGLEAGGFGLGPQLIVIRQFTARVGGGRIEDPHRPSSQTVADQRKLLSRREGSPSATVESWQSARARARFHEDNYRGDMMRPKRVSATLGTCSFIMKEQPLDVKS